MRISDWSSDVCSSDLLVEVLREPLTARFGERIERHLALRQIILGHDADRTRRPLRTHSAREARSGAIGRRLLGAVGGGDTLAVDPNTEDACLISRCTTTPPPTKRPSQTTTSSKTSCWSRRSRTRSEEHK